MSFIFLCWQFLCVVSVSCPNGWLKDPSDEYCLFLIHDDMIFTECVEFCAGLGGTLPCVQSSSQNDFLQQQVDGTVWLGLYESLEEFNWVSGCSPLYFDWAESEPDDFCGVDERCTVLVEGHWQDVYCQEEWECVCSWPGNVSSHYLEVSSSFLEEEYCDGEELYENNLWILQLVLLALWCCTTLVFAYDTFNHRSVGITKHQVFVLSSLTLFLFTISSFVSIASTSYFAGIFFSLADSSRFLILLLLSKGWGIYNYTYITSRKVFYFIILLLHIIVAILQNDEQTYVLSLNFLDRIVFFLVWIYILVSTFFTSQRYKMEADISPQKNKIYNQFIYAIVVFLVIDLIVAIVLLSFSAVQKPNYETFYLLLFLCEVLISLNIYVFVCLLVYFLRLRPHGLYFVLEDQGAEGPNPIISQLTAELTSSAPPPFVASVSISLPAPVITPLDPATPPPPLPDQEDDAPPAYTMY
eukprot:Lithocolla_globosa_v1_NODE_4068_length_1518_cov_4.879699.p1 type:complete len:469 gc:universal NODE_4068_length_1518_cov_4.879699:1432-26(-)